MDADIEQYIDIFRTIFDLHLTKNDLQQLKPDLVQKIYSNFLKDFGADFNMITQIPLGASDQILGNQEMYQATYNILGLARTIQYYLKLIFNVEDFFLSDLIQPKQKRTYRFFSMLIDFYSYLNENLPRMKEVKEEVMAKKEEKKRIISSIDNFKMELNKRSLQNAEVETALDEEMRALKVSSLRMEKSRDSKNQLKATLEQRKEELRDRRQDYKKRELNLLESKKDCDRLNSLCVTDEEKRQINDVELELSNKEKCLQGVKDTLKENQKNLEVISKAEEFISKTLLPIVTEIEDEAQKTTKVNSNLRDNAKSLSQILEKDDELLRKLQLLNEEVANLQEKRSTHQQTMEMRKLGFVEELKVLKLTYKEINQGNEENHIVIQDLKSDIENIKFKIDQEAKELYNCKADLKLWIYKLSDQISRKEKDIEEENNEVMGKLMK